VNIQQNYNSGNYFTPYYHQLNKRLTSSFPVEGKMYELVKRITMLAVYPFISILALFESGFSLIYHAVARRETAPIIPVREQIPGIEEQPDLAAESFHLAEEVRGQQRLAEEMRLAEQLLAEEQQLRTERQHQAIEQHRLEQQRIAEDQLRAEQQRRLEELRKAQELLLVFDFASLPDDLKILVLSCCAPDVKCQLVFVSKFTNKTVQFDAAMHKMGRALDWILVHPDLMEKLKGNPRGRQLLIDYLSCDITPWETKSSDFLKNVFNIFFKFGTDEEIARFMLMITKDLSYRKSLKILFNELNDERFARLLLFPKCEDFLIPICAFSPILKKNGLKKIDAIYQKIPNSHWWDDIKQASDKALNGTIAPAHLSGSYCGGLRWLEGDVIISEIIYLLDDETLSAEDMKEKVKQLFKLIKKHYAKGSQVTTAILELMLDMCVEKKLEEKKIIRLFQAFIGHRTSWEFIINFMNPKFQFYPLLMQEFLPKMVNEKCSQGDLNKIIELIEEEDQAICFIKACETLPSDLSSFYLSALAHGMGRRKSPFNAMQSVFDKCGLNIDLYPKLDDKKCNPFFSICHFLDEEKEIQRKLDKEKAKEETQTRLQAQELEISRLKEQLAASQQS
jgi:hypothetical protein